MNRRQFVIAFVSVVIGIDAHAYELGTHARLTQKAYEQSILGNAQIAPLLFKDLGVELKDNPFGDRYYDMFGTDVKERGVADTFELKHMPADAKPLSVSGWLMRGAIREDDYARAFGVWVAPNPQGDTDSPQAFWRVMHHFYDPVGDRALTLPATQAGLFTLATGEGTNFHRAPDWATGSTNAFANPLLPNPTRRNHFTVLDAREAMYRALTGRDSTGKEVAKTKEERNKYWATTFRALGDAVHLIQDMAQPQHTRNDTHSGAPGFGHKSIYEAYIDCRATGQATREVRNEGVKQCNPLPYDGYAPPRFTKYANFFSTREGSNGRGLADYSNRGFFSAGTNLGSNSYPLPLNNRNAYSQRVLTIEPNVTTSLLEGTVQDTLTGISSTNVALTTESLWYQPLADFAAPGEAENLGYSLGKHNYDAMASLLIPRAVAYSAGLVDYFFRGRISTEGASFSDDGTQTIVNLKVKNAIDPSVATWKDEIIEDRDSQEKMSTFILTVQYRLDGSERFVSSGPSTFNPAYVESIAPGKASNQTLTFILPSLPAKATDVQYRLIFRGRLGQEDDAVLAGPVNPISGFVFYPSYTPADDISGSRVIYKRGGQWVLSSEQGRVAENIDWKGWYVNGKPTKVLSWRGPSSRYFSAYWEFNFTPNIYQHGELFAVAPASVLGAAIAKDSKTGQEWLVAICSDGASDAVYRRPNKKSDKPDMYDPVTGNVDGWQLLNRFPLQNGMAAGNTPWFFNGEGTEAQTIRKVTRKAQGTLFDVVMDQESNWNKVPISLSSRYYAERLKIAVTEGSANLTNLGNGAVSNTSDVVHTRIVLPDCTPSGCPTDQTTEYTSNVIGSVVIAVDYDERGNEILLKYEINESQRDYYHGWPYNSVHEYKSSVQNRINLNGQFVDIFNVNFDLTSNWNEKNEEGITQKLNNGQVLLRAISYADIRNALLVFSESDKRYSKPCPDTNPASYYQGSSLRCVVYRDTDKYVVRINGADITINQSTIDNVGAGMFFTPNFQFPENSRNQSNMMTDDYLGRAPSGSGRVWAPITPIPTSSRSPKPLQVGTSDIYKMLYISIVEPDELLQPAGFYGSGIAVNGNKELLFSVGYYDESGVKYFNYLTDVEPTNALMQKVPIAPEGASYYPVGVIW